MVSDASGPVVGLLLAAGAGRRAGGPKALRRDPDGTWWLVRALSALQQGGCDNLIVVLGAESAAAQAIVDDEVREVAATVDVVVAPDWAGGMSRSLRAGLERCLTSRADRALVHLVDLPDIGVGVVRRVLDRTGGLADPLARAAYRGEPGHPVLIGRSHWPPLLDHLADREPVSADRGGRSYLAHHGVRLVECGDLASGRDVDFPSG